MRIKYFEAHLREIEQGANAIRMLTELESKKLSDLFLTFVVDIANRKEDHIYPVSSNIETVTQNESTKIAIEIPNFSFDPSLTYDELTNIGAFELSGKDDDGIPFSLSIPVFCSDEFHIEILSPIANH